jgi:hypothetical protein
MVHYSPNHSPNLPPPDRPETSFNPLNPMSYPTFSISRFTLIALSIRLLNAPAQFSLNSLSQSPSQFTLSIHPLNSPSQFTLSIHPLNSPSQFTLSIHTQFALSIHALNSHPQSTLSIHPQSTLSIHPQSTLSIYTLNPPFSHLLFCFNDTMQICFQSFVEEQQMEGDWLLCMCLRCFPSHCCSFRCQCGWQFLLISFSFYFFIYIALRIVVVYGSFLFCGKTEKESHNLIFVYC